MDSPARASAAALAAPRGPPGHSQRPAGGCASGGGAAGGTAGQLGYAVDAGTSHMAGRGVLQLSPPHALQMGAL
jgi:hypothetical protein